MASSNVKIIPFCVPLPSSSSLSDPNNANSAGSTATDSGFGIVGTITLRGQSAVVWFGWGAIDSIKEDDINVDDDNGSGRRMDGVVSVGHGECFYILRSIHKICPSFMTSYMSFISISSHHDVYIY